MFHPVLPKTPSHQDPKNTTVLGFLKITKPPTMSREAYQVPAMGTQNAFSNEGFANIDKSNVAYLCGECSARVTLKSGDQIRCKDCGHRVLYKERTKR